MSDELSALVRETALEDEAAAGREYPYSPATLGRYVRDVRRRRATGGAMLAVAGVVVIGGAVFGVDRLGQADAPTALPVGDPTSSVTPTPDRTATPTPTPTLEPTPSATPTPSPTSVPVETPPPPPQEPPPPPPVAPPPAPPGTVTSVDAGQGGGSGEIAVNWETIPGATGYRVYRSDSADGPFVASASVDVSGGTTVEYGGLNEYTYIGIWAPSGHSYEYIEVLTGQATWFRVSAFNAGGEGPTSATVCGAPIGYPDC